jgi:uncharacterized delta-60 repeat protein
MKISLLTSAVAALALAAGPVAAADGDLDPTFWGDGAVTLGGVGEYYTADVLAAPDGRLAVVATQWFEGDPRWSWRGIGDSSADPSYCAFEPPEGNGQAVALAAAFNHAGRLVVAGVASYSLGNQVAVARFLYPDCAVDTSFSGDGYFSVDLPGGDEQARAVAVDAANGLVIAGVQIQGSTRDLLVLRLDEDGELDSTFSSNGWLVLDPTEAALVDDVEAVAIDAQGRMLVGGTTYHGADGSNGDMIAARFLSSGQLDPSFSGDGLIRVPFDLDPSAPMDQLLDLSVDRRDGGIVLAGTAHGTSGWLAVLARLTADGALDASFGGDGRLAEALGQTTSEFRGIAIDQLGRVVAVGGADATTLDFLIARATRAGALDPVFSDDGWLRLPFDVGFWNVDRAMSVALQGDRIIAAGDIDTDNGSRIALVAVENTLFTDGFESGDLAEWSGAVP